MRRHLHLTELTNSPLCRRCGGEEETSAHILCEREALASLRHAHLGAFCLDPEDITNLSLGAIWNFSKRTGLPWTGIRLCGTRGPFLRPRCIGTIRAQTQMLINQTVKYTSAIYGGQQRTTNNTTFLNSTHLKAGNVHVNICMSQSYQSLEFPRIYLRVTFLCVSIITSIYATYLFQVSVDQRHELRLLNLNTNISIYDLSKY